MDYLQSCLHAYFAHTRWRPRRQYAALLHESRALLDFATPAGFAFALAKPVTTSLHAAYTLGLPATGAVGFLFTSAPLPDTAPVLADQAMRVVHDVDDDRVVGSYLLYGRLFRDARLEYLAARRLSLRTLLTVSGASSWRPGASFVNYVISTNRDSGGHEFCFASHDAVFGFRWLQQLSSRIDVGGELYYLANEVSGGLSFGAKYRGTADTATLTLNPIMGHVAATYSSHITRGLSAGCRYDYNIHSFESDLAVGVAFRRDASNDEDEVGVDGAGTWLRVRYGIARGLALVYQQQWHSLHVRLGLLASGAQNAIGIEASYCIE
ncbi:hypothetical protein AMAG_08618 [Allomyces macrogynus ATCC 38327]|uniref:Mitochondrial distribution and morphology protein 10 n=1 Tax=Allomyces macrogynus (strain ATCC 38327) TaxID=578462 RepID=A0A0L0SLU8_ALLM3|nr:hypothetical protein AMAG_08618 [Allomyces macrogynus ATCC 38327]|eukprot:KNE63496.1 hypothetical protein AMAG_08618 [Allomyces macrogynus ATCC 38327]